ncbi:hypothetical protein GQX48_01830, partial [Staphylococcus aureus]|nr:hypothetical protein [Staphylococcus aureus]
MLSVSLYTSQKKKKIAGLPSTTPLPNTSYHIYSQTSILSSQQSASPALFTSIMAHTRLATHPQASAIISLMLTQ